jgi:hypothetical protein
MQSRAPKPIDIGVENKASLGFRSQAITDYLASWQWFIGELACTEHPTCSSGSDSGSVGDGTGAGAAAVAMLTPAGRLRFPCNPEGTPAPLEALLSRSPATFGHEEPHIVLA